MRSQSLIDANVPIYAAGGDHPLKEPSIQILSLAVRHPRAFLTDAEVLQELLHRYLALRRWRLEGKLAFETFADAMQGHIEAIHAEDVERAARLADEHSGLSARDLVHLAVMHRLEVTHIVTADRTFDQVRDVTRLDPAEVAAWGPALVSESNT